MKRAKLKAFYSVPELAEMTGVGRGQLRRLLESNGVVLHRNGRKLVVYLSDIKRSMPDLWESTLDVLAVVA